jgi:hypothetical protein
MWRQTLAARFVVLPVAVAALVLAARGASAEEARPAADAFQDAVARRARANVPGDIFLPFLAPAVEPETRRLSEAEAADALERDWLFQAMGEPVAGRARKEIGWARDLAARLSRTPRPPDLAAELAELDGLEKRLADLSSVARRAKEDAGPPGPKWIWFPEGRPVENAPAAARYFRRTFDLPVGASVKRADLRVAADDACEVFVNGARLGSHDTWQRAAAFAMPAGLLRPGRNVLAVRAENRPTNGPNPAGLIARLAVTLADAAETVVESDASWRSAQDAPAGWHETGFDDAAWPAAVVAAPLGGGPWRDIAGLGPVASGSPAERALYLAVRQAKRRMALKNAAIDFAELLFIDQPYPNGPEWLHESIHRMSIRAVPGGRLLVLKGLGPGGEIRKLAPARPGSFWRPDLSFDAGRVLFCYKAHDEKSFHLYETGIDGKGLRRVTDGPYDDIDPIYLPDGRILFTTTRGNSYVRCGPFIYSALLSRCDADGRNLYILSCGNETEWTPALMGDGRVIYSRWEYTDKPLWRIQSLWTANPDGTATAVFWGNQTVWPDHLSEPRQVPGTTRVMFSGVGHHDWFSGSIGIVDPGKGLNFPLGLTKVTCDLPWPECGPPPQDPHERADYHASGRYTGYKTPYPLTEDDFLVSARGEGDKFRLYLMDTRGNRELLYEGAHNIWHAVPVRPQPRPPRIPDRVAWPGTGKDRTPPAPGLFYSADVCQGVPDLPRDKVRYLRVFQTDHKTYSTWRKTYRNSGPPVSIIQEEGVKRILSEVPVRADGSVYFQAPPGRALHFQLLDEHRRCLQTMRSFTGLMPGEQRGCVGCHESHSTAPPAKAGLAMRDPPSDVTPPPWGDESIGYERFAQPVLDRYCGPCHQGDGKARKTFDLTLRPGHGPFKEPYLTLVGAAGWGNPVAGSPAKGCGIAGAIPVETMDPSTRDPKAYATLRPMRYLSYTSPLIERAMSGKHHDVKVDALSLHRLIAWVDACCPFCGEPEVRAVPDPDFACIDELPIRPRVATAPIIERP